MSWEKERLEDIAQIISGQSPDSKYYNREKNGLPFFQGKADFGDENPIVRYWCTEPTKIAQPKDILLSVRAPVGPTNICNQESCIGRGLAAIRVGSKLCHKYLYWWFKSFEEKIAAKGNGSTFSSITSKDIKELEIPLPPLEVQKQIADTLDKADELRKKDELLLKKYDELAQSIFYDMFGDPVKNEKGWEVKKGRDIVSVFGGAAFKSTDYQDYGIPLIRIGTINKGFFDESQLVYLPSTFVESYKRYLVKPNDLLITLTGTVGKDDYGNVYIMNDKFELSLLNQRVAKLSVNREYLTNRFFEFLLKQKDLKSLLTGISRGVRQANISNEDIYNLDIVIPPITLQNEFEQKVELLHLQKKMITETVDKSETLFNGLLNTYFS